MRFFNYRFFNYREITSPSALESNWPTESQQMLDSLNERAKKESEKDFALLESLVCGNERLMHLLSPLSTLAGQTNGKIVAQCLVAILSKGGSLGLKIAALYQLQSLTSFPEDSGSFTDLQKIIIYFLLEWGFARVLSDIGDFCLSLAARNNNLNLTQIYLTLATKMNFETFQRAFMYTNVNGNLEPQDTAAVAWQIYQPYYHLPDFFKNVFGIIFSSIEVATLLPLFIYTAPVGTTVGISLGTVVITNLLSAFISYWNAGLKVRLAGMQSAMHVQVIRYISNMLHFKILDTSLVELNYYNDVQNQLLEAGRNTDIVKGLMKIFQSALLSLSFGLVLSYFAEIALNPTDPSVIFADIIFLVNFFLLIVGPLTSISDNWLTIFFEINVLNNARVFLNKLREKVKEQIALEQVAPRPVDPDQGTLVTTTHVLCTDVIVSFQNVQFAYPNSSNNVLSEISFAVKTNESVALLGPSGVGKSTILHLLMGLYGPKEGRVIYYDNTGSEISSNVARRFFAAVPQEPLYFPASNFRYNIKYGNGHPENYGRNTNDTIDVMVDRAVTQSLLEDVYVRTDNGQHPAKGLSGGEKKRVGLARSLMQDPRLFIFDEPTEGLDPKNAATFIDTFNNLPHNASLLVITHDLPTIQSVDRILFLYKDSAGVTRLSEGTYNELSRTLPEFQKFIQLQTTKFASISSRPQPPEMRREDLQYDA